jgi:Lar family restriction alleviation protein
MARAKKVGIMNKPESSVHSSDLLACPFCGGTAHEVHFDARLNELPAFVECLGCKAFGPDGKGRQGAIDAWNKRYANTTRSGAERPAGADGSAMGEKNEN